MAESDAAPDHDRSVIELLPTAAPGPNLLVPGRGREGPEIGALQLKVDETLSLVLRFGPSVASETRLQFKEIQLRFVTPS
jgi:hypothetical protein